ncbi:forkhead box protein R1 [Lampris incognitus]|uniref:forkhead box protein R1 n=1 Tax=Lampris incognitus TaxID=2546036 RepID=UPI0024B540C9|nr:forkhead box protein R1 [Lampris incognitus]
MPLHFMTSRFFDLHCSTGLTDWDMDEEMKLATTTDQFYQADDKIFDKYLVQWHYARISRRKDAHAFCGEKSEFLVQPNLWLMVNPNLVCPLQYVKDVPVEQPTPRAVKTHPVHGEFSTSATAGPSQAEPTSSAECMLGGPDVAASVDVPMCRKRTIKARDSKTVKLGGWHRPPVNYCILIAIALSCSRTGSLNVQQIYNFTREHFPFFQTAPDGWKNTIRHNLCFSDSFCKSPHQLGSKGKRKSCLWHLTLDGQQRLRDVVNVLKRKLFEDLKKSMSHPGETRVIPTKRFNKLSE